MNVFQPNPGPDAPLAIQRKVNAEDSTFGDNYRQTVTFGVQPIRSEVTLTWPALSLEEMSDLDDFFVGQAGTPFLYTLPLEAVERVWYCTEWSPKGEGGTLYSFEALIKERFDRA